MISTIIKQLYEKGKYQEVLNLLSNLEKKGSFASLPEDEQMLCRYYHTCALEGLGFHEESIKIAKITQTAFIGSNYKFLLLLLLVAEINALINLGRIDEALEISIKGDILVESLSATECQTAVFSKGQFEEVKGTIHYSKGLLDQALEHYQQSLKLREINDNKQNIAKSLNNIGNVYSRKGELDRSLDYHQRSLNLRRTFGNKRECAMSLNNIGLVYWRKGNLKNALEHFQPSLTLYEKFGNQEDIAMSLNNIGLIYKLKGELNNALEYFQRSLTISKITNNKQTIAYALHNISTIYAMKGFLKTALEYLNRSFVLLKEGGNKQDIAMSSVNIGRIYSLRGLFNKALEYYHQSLSLFEEIGNKQHIAIILDNIGGMYLQKGMFDTALKYYQRSLTLCETIGNDLNTSEVLFHLIHLLLKIEDENQIQIYFNQLQNLYAHNANKLIQLRSQLAQILILIQSGGIKNVTRARSSLEHIIQDEIVDYELTILARLTFCQLIFEQFVFTGEESTLTKLKDLLNETLKLAARKQYHGVVLAILILQGKVELLQLKLESAKSFLHKVIAEAQEKGYDHLKAQCEEELKKLEVIKDYNLVTQHQEAERKRFQQQQTEEIISYLKTIFTQFPARN